MSANLMNVFTSVDLSRVGKHAADLVSLEFKTNKRTGSKIARAVFKDGVSIARQVTESGVISQTITKLPEITSIAQRNDVIRDLIKNGKTQQEVAALMGVSQSLVSTVLNKK